MAFFKELAGSPGNLKNTRLDCVLFCTQMVAAQKFSMVAWPLARPVLPSPIPQGSPAVLWSQGEEPGQAVLQRSAHRGGAGMREARRGGRGRRGAPAYAWLRTQLLIAVSSWKDLPPPPQLHLPPAQETAAFFPQCTLAPWLTLLVIKFLG